VQSTLGAGTPVLSYDPAITARSVPSINLSSGQSANLWGAFVAAQYRASHSWLYAGLRDRTSVSVQFNNSRQTTNSPFFNLSPVLSSMYRFSFQQQLLAGFGLGPNLRYLRIANNNRKISDIAFKDQVITTVTQIENIYWDLVDAYQQAQVSEQSLAFAQQSFDTAKKQLKLESIPEMDVMRAEAEFQSAIRM